MFTAVRKSTYTIGAGPCHSIPHLFNFHFPPSSFLSPYFHHSQILCNIIHPYHSLYLHLPSGSPATFYLPFNSFSVGVYRILSFLSSNIIFCILKVRLEYKCYQCLFLVVFSTNVCAADMAISVLMKVDFSFCFVGQRWKFNFKNSCNMVHNILYTTTNTAVSLNCTAYPEYNHDYDLIVMMMVTEIV